MTESIQRPKPGERWRASYEGVVIPEADHPSTNVWFALKHESDRAPEEFFQETGRGWRYEKLAGTREEQLLELLGELTDADRCMYDHNRFCQTHHRDSPCANERALEIVMAARAAKTEARNDV